MQPAGAAPTPSDRSQSMGRRGQRAAPADIASAFGPRGGPRLYKLFLLSPWVLFRLLIYRLPLITGLRLYSFRRRDEPIAHRLDANSVPLFLRRSHTFSAAPATIIIFPLPPPHFTSAPTPPPSYISLAPLRLSVGASEIGGGEDKKEGASERRRNKIGASRRIREESAREEGLAGARGPAGGGEKE